MGKGFYVTIKSKINQIHNLLNDNYSSGFPIIKELIQNADDANSTNFHIGYCNGLKDVKHPLLKNEALFVVNNGIFTYEHEEALSSLNLSSKSGEIYSVGRFGLGLKSIFHICEVFFYIPSKTGRENNHCKNAEVLSPWFDKYHKEWNEFSTDIDQKAIEKFLIDIIRNEEQWFCLWFPIRKREDFYSDDAFRITESYPDCKKYFEQNIEVKFAQIIPMLKNLKNIYGWLPDENNKLKQNFSIKLINNSQQIRKLNEQEDLNKHFSIRGGVNVKTLDNEYICNFNGLQTIIDDHKLKSLKELKDWPKFLDEEDRKYKPEKAIAECGVVFTSYPKLEDKKTLEITKAVYLPVGDEPFEVLDLKNLNSNNNYYIILHGYFFVDSGRREIHFESNAEGEKQIRCEWNKILLEKGTLPLVLPALEKFVKECDLSNDDIYKITYALQDTDIVKNKYRQNICQDNIWLSYIAKEGIKWDLINNQYFLIPKYDNVNELYNIFPEFVNLTDNNYITFEHYPKIAYNDHKKTKLNQNKELLLEILNNINAENIFTNKKYLEYLIKFLNNKIESSDITQKLYCIARNVFKNIDIEKLEELQEDIKEFLVHIKDKIFVINTPKESIKEQSKELLKNIFSLNLDTLIITDNFFDSDEQAKPNISNTDIHNICNIINDFIHKNDLLNKNNELYKYCINIVLEIISKCKIDKSIINSLEIFEAYNYYQKQKVLLSLKDIDTLKANKQIFKHSNEKNEEKLQKAFYQVEIFSISQDILRQLDIQIVSCTVSSCFELIAQKPNLANEDERSELIKLLKETHYNNDYQTCLRYLLHGFKNDKNNGTLWIKLEEYDIWQKIILSNNKGWQIISQKLTDDLSNTQKQILKIESINIDNVINFIEKNVEKINENIKFDDNERFEIFKQLNIRGKTDLLKELLIHKDLINNFITIDSDTYLEGSSPIEAGLSEFIKIVKKEDSINDIQKQIIKPLDEKNVIIIALDKAPTKYYMTILNLLSKVNLDKDPNLTNKLKTIKWLKLKTGDFISAQDIIYLEPLENEVTEIFNNLKNQTYKDHKILDESIIKHKNKLIPLFISQEESIERLISMMSEQEEYRLGSINYEKLDLNEFIKVFEPMSADILPAFSFIKSAFRKGVIPNIESLDPLFDKISDDRFIKILNYLSDKHQKEQENKENILKFYNLYLKAVVNEYNFMDILKDIKFLNKKGKWKVSGKLSLNMDNIDDEYLINIEQEQIIKQFISNKSNDFPNKDENDKNVHSENTVENLKKYFNKWVDCINNPEIIGAFLSLLGDDPGIRDLASIYLGKWSIENTRLKFKWNFVSPEFHKINDVMEKIKFNIEIYDKDDIEIISILNKHFIAKMKKKFEHLILDFKQIKGSWLHSFKFLKIDVENYSSIELSNFLKESVRYIYKQYFQTEENIDEIWEDLNKSEQLDIGISQSLILENAFYSFKQLKIESQDIKEILKEFEDLRAKKAEEESNKLDIDQTLKEIKTLENSLKEMIENNIRLNAIGQLEKLPEDVRTALQRTIESTGKNKGMLLNLALSYGGRAEIVDMVKAIAGKVIDGKVEPYSITPEIVADHLYTRGMPDPDLLIRTSGEMRISNFLLWQIAYAEIFITDTLWPDFGKDEFIKILIDFQRRERRFGNVR